MKLNDWNSGNWREKNISLTDWNAQYALKPALFQLLGAETPKGWNVRMLHFRDIFSHPDISNNWKTRIAAKNIKCCDFVDVPYLKGISLLYAICI